MSHRNSLETKILGNPVLSVIFDSGLEVFIVGGYIRDLLRGSPSADIDFVLRGEIRSLVARVAERIGGKSLEFDKGPLMRIIFGRTTLDFTELKGKLEDDLSARDFTMNALAWSPRQGLVDPFSGSRDIDKGIIRAISRQNLINDPLRLLRAYRFAAELGWRIDPSTRKLLRDLRGLITQPAPERITLELWKLLDSDNYKYALRSAFLDGLLTSFLSVNSDELGRNVKALSKFNGFLEKLHDRFNLNFAEICSQGLTYVGLLRAEVLLLGVNLAGSRLRLSGALSERIPVTGRLLTRYRRLERIDKSQLLSLFEGAGTALMDFALLSQRERIVKEALRFGSIRSLIGAEEIMTITGVKEGPFLGEILKDQRRMQFLGRIVDRKDALLRIEKVKRGEISLDRFD